MVNVLENDELKELPATTDNVHINVLEPEPNDYIILNPDGSVDISPDAPSGIYVINYSICEIGNDTNCADGTVTI